MLVRAGVSCPRREHGRADADDHQPGGEVEPRIEPVGDDPLREQERHAAEREHAGGVGRGRDQPEQRRVPRRAARADDVGGDDRLAVPGRERVRRAPEEREHERDEHDERAEMARGRRARRSRGPRPGRARERLPGEERRRCVVRRRQCAAARATSSGLESRSFGYARSSLEAARRVRAEDDLLPADAVGVVRGRRPRHGRAPRSRGPREDRLEARRAQPGRAGGMRERVSTGTTRGGRDRRARRR